MLMAVVMAFGVNILISVGATVLGFTIIGYLAVPFLAFVGQSAIMYVWGRGFADAYDEEYGEPPLAPTTGTGGTHRSGPATTGVDEPTGDSYADDSSWSNDTDDDGFGTSAGTMSVTVTAGNAVAVTRHGGHARSHRSTRTAGQLQPGDGKRAGDAEKCEGDGRQSRTASPNVSASAISPSKAWRMDSRICQTPTGPQ